MVISRLILVRKRNVSKKNLQRKSKHTFHILKNFSENRAAYEIMWKNDVKPDRPQGTV
jgi:hypothetical protein